MSSLERVSPHGGPFTSIAKMLGGGVPRIAGLVAAMVLTIGCLEEAAWSPVFVPDSYERFTREVAPIFEARCALPTCHGTPARPLEVFAVGQHRLDPADLHLLSPLTEVERQANFIKACAFLDPALTRVTDPLSCPLVSKPLAPAAGGSAHAGGTQFEDLSDAELAVVRAWIAEAQRQQLEANP